MKLKEKIVFLLNKLFHSPLFSKNNADWIIQADFIFIFIFLVHTIEISSFIVRQFIDFKTVYLKLVFKSFF